MCFYSFLVLSANFKLLFPTKCTEIEFYWQFPFVHIRKGATLVKIRSKTYLGTFSHK